jgi:ribonuclease HIII
MQQSVFVTHIDPKLSDKLLIDLKNQDFEISTPPYTIFAAKKKGISCTLYQSGKLVVQGKEHQAFVEFYLEPEILQSFPMSHPLVGKDVTPHIGIDESGKGDFFGPLCIAGVFAKEEDFAKLQEMGVKDSKALGDPAIQKIATKIRAHCLYHVVKINPAKYNQIYAEFKNLNRLLAWGHATTIEQLIEKSNCRDVIIDQFADEHVVLLALKRKKLMVNLTQRHRGEEDLVVAAASILARDAFIKGLAQLGEELGMILPKGASAAVKAAGQKILQKWGQSKLLHVSKAHFKTFTQITQGASDE